MNTKDDHDMTRFSYPENLDPAVNFLIDQGDRRKAEAHLPRDERSHKKKERERAFPRKPHCINLDLPIEMKERLIALAN
jgi:hypothetical protein